eukprot:symbB.v1.2.028321.t1/scaffold2879.1/size76250/3
MRFGIRPECQATVIATGAFVKVHAVDEKLIEKGMSKMPSDNHRQDLCAPEDSVRFYLHLILEPAVVIYLDPDTIVQADLAELRNQLLASGKTIGFAERATDVAERKTDVKMDNFLRKPTGCSAELGASWEELMTLPCYNAGVFVVNLQRWRDQHVAERIEELVEQHNQCGGELWVGSQVPLNLAFLNPKQGQEKDYIAVPADWNYAGLGGVLQGIDGSKFLSKKVLHWSGSLKPWKSDGLFKEIWLPHRQRFDSLLKPDASLMDVASRTAGVVGDASPEGQDLHQEGGSSGDTECHDTHPNADSPDMLHVVYASGANYLEGVQASVASVVSSTPSPDELTVHIITQAQSLNDFKMRFGIRPECRATLSATGALIKVHAVDEKLIGKAKVSDSRQELGAPENLARFYMHLILEPAVVIYLDPDTIVQADLAQLRNQLLASGKTIGFVARETRVNMDICLKRPNGCRRYLGASYNKLIRLPCYNVGVFAVNLQRWRDQHVVERIEELVEQQNRCGGELWAGASQVPLLLAFLNPKKGRKKDYIVVPAEWDSTDLGWREGINVSKLPSKKVLHWTGRLKPWTPDGLYKEIWLPHRQRFDSLLKPKDSFIDVASRSAGRHHTVFTFVREPLARFISGFAEIERTYHTAHFDFFRTAERGSLEQAQLFINRFFEDGVMYNGHVKPQSEFLAPFSTSCGLRMDFIGKTEDLANDWQRFLTSQRCAATHVFRDDRGQHPTDQVEKEAMSTLMGVTDTGALNNVLKSNDFAYLRAFCWLSLPDYVIFDYKLPERCNDRDFLDVLRLTQDKLKTS